MFMFKSKDKKLPRKLAKFLLMDSQYVRNGCKENKITEEHYSASKHRQRRFITYLLTWPQIFCIRCWGHCSQHRTNSSTVFLLHKGGEGEIAGLMFAIKAKLIASTTTNKKEDVPTNSLLWRKYHGLWRNWWKVRPGQDTLQITLQVFWDAFQDAWDSVWRRQLSHLSKNPASNVRAAETLDTELNQGGTSETMTTNTNTEQMTWEGGHKYCSIYQSIKWLGLIFTKGSVKFVWKLLKLYSTMYPLLFFQVCACAGLIF